MEDELRGEAVCMLDSPGLQADSRIPLSIEGFSLAEESTHRGHSSQRTMQALFYCGNNRVKLPGVCIF